MSYDLYLFFADPAQDLLSQAEAALEEEESREGRGARRKDPELTRRRVAIARALLNVNPEFEVFPPLEELEQYLGEAEAPKKAVPQGTELSAPEGGNGLQISLFNGSGAITLPYWHEGSSAEVALNEIQSYLLLLRDEFKMYAYDQQIGKVIEPGTDKVAQLGVYEPHVHRVRKLGEDSE